jgi:hypothetical protein
MNPSTWRDGGRGETIHWAVADTWLGTMLVAATSRGICRLSFDEDEAELRRRFPHARIEPGGAELQDLLARTVAAVNAPERPHDLPLDVRGTAFQEAVWRELARVPPRRTSQLRRPRRQGRQTGSRPGRRHRLRRQPNRHPHPLPPRATQRRQPRRLCLWARPQGAAG